MMKPDRHSLHNYCRICLECLTSSDAPIIHLRQAAHLTKFLDLCTKLDITNDVEQNCLYPKSICIKCYNKLQIFKDVCIMAQNSDEMLRKIVEKDKINKLETLTALKQCDNKELDLKIDNFELSQPELIVPRCKMVNNDDNLSTGLQDIRKLHHNCVEMEEFIDNSNQENDSAVVTSVAAIISNSSGVEEQNQSADKDADLQSIIDGCNAAFKTNALVTNTVDFIDSTSQKSNDASEPTEDSDCNSMKDEMYLKSKTYKMGFKCLQCSAIMSNKRNLIRHMTNIHDGIYVCKFCPKRFKDNIKKELHEIEHDTKMFSCEICHSRFDSEMGQKRHTHNKHQRRLRRFVCSYCPRRFKGTKPKELHEREHKLKSCTTEMLSDSTSKKFTCRFCLQVLSSKPNLLRHVRNMHEGIFSCTFCPKRFKNKSYQLIHESEHDTKPFSCKFCYKRYIEETLLEQHIYINHQKKNHMICKFCPKLFKEITRKEKHEKEHETKSFACELCFQRFKKEATLKLHLDMCWRL